MEKIMILTSSFYIINWLDINNFFIMGNCQQTCRTICFDHRRVTSNPNISNNREIILIPK